MGAKNMTLAVATDLHYLSSGLRDNGEAFGLMTGFSDGALTMYGDELVDAFISEMEELHPDAVLITGDLTFNGEKKSHEYLAEKFGTLWRSGIPVLLIPGNHDIANPLAGSYLGSEARPAESVSRDEFCRIYETPAFCREHFFMHDVSSLSFVYALADDVWLMCLDVNGNGLPGALTDENLSWAENVLETARDDNIRVISVTHQNLFAHNGLLSAGFVMEGAGRLSDLYICKGVHLNLSGHMHIQHIKEKNKVSEIVTSAMMIPPCQYGILNINGDLAIYRSKIIDVASWALKTGSTDQNLLDFPEFAASFYRDTMRRRLDAELAEAGLPEAEKDELAGSMCKLNQAFFAGSLTDLEEREHLRSECRERLPGNFWNDYIDSVFDEGIKDERNAVVRL